MGCHQACRAENEAGWAMALAKLAALVESR
jgi:hypothetical protein